MAEPQDIRMLFEAAEREMRWWRLRRNLLLLIMAVWLAAVVFFFRLPYGLWRYVDVTFSVLMLVVGPHGLRLLWKMTKPHEHTVVALCSQDDTRVVGCLLSVIPAVMTGTYSQYFAWGTHNTDDRDTIKQIAGALMRLLPVLSEHDYRALTEGQRIRLYRLLLWVNSDPNLADVTLRTLLRFNDRQAVPWVARMANLAPQSISARRLTQSARDCLLLFDGRAA